MPIIDNLVKDMTTAEKLEKLEEEGKNLTQVRRLFWFGIKLQGVYLNYLVIASWSL